ncbi:hypothetical protein O3G_MSEX013460 [Manduca sexta]|uniref:Uncharacterized protein n=1 Tax=Manduca sexta TaxID=7130 RepID=A0A921ZTM8_MANSE|nr:hypothetical protein O3G_MSEX013460 [Manduca sexta]
MIRVTVQDLRNLAHLLHRPRLPSPDPVLHQVRGQVLQDLNHIPLDLEVPPCCPDLETDSVKLLPIVFCFYFFP